ncbi:hypothetical protein IH980_03670 [Patescibacteria group bacterium]|nr:hypothetical protein [Patescibacteria group bacterium]
MKRLLLSLFTIGIVGATAIGLSSAFFSDTETSTDNTFTAGSLDLKIDGEDNPSAIISVDDLKPGDDLIEEKILRIIDNPAKVWMHIKDLVSAPGTLTEPEELEESLDGEKHDIENFLAYDLKVDEDVIIHFDDGNLLPEVVSCWIPLGTLPGAENVTVEQSFHFDEDVTNWAQGDTLTFTEEFYAQQVSDPTIPETGSGRTWNSDSKRCEVSDVATVYDSPPFTCSTGATDTSTALGTVTITDTGVDIEVEVTLVGATPSSSYDIWINQDPGGCPLGSPTAPGAIPTDGFGDGVGTASAPKVIGATDFWISAVGGGQVLRSTSVSL